MENYYILFVKTQKEEEICDGINKSYTSELLFAFTPKTVIARRKPKPGPQLSVLFPGYVFIRSKLYAHEFMKTINIYITRNKQIYKLLGHNNPDTMALNTFETEKLHRICDKDYVLNVSYGVIENNQVYITKGPLAGNEGSIIKIDRHKRKAVIAMSILGEKSMVTVPLEIYNKN